MADSKKMTKGTVAIAAGVVLLLGGAGTYALWEVSDSIGGSVQAGDLNLVVGDADWTLNGDPVVDPTDLHIVPGDTLVLEQVLTITAVGDDLQAQLRIDEGGNFVSNPDFADLFDVALQLDMAWDGADNIYEVPSGLDAEEVGATVTITFDEDAAGRDGTNVTLDLEQLSFTLQQVTGNDSN